MNQVDNDWMVNTLVRAVQHVPKVIVGACRRGVAGGVIENALHWRGSGRIGLRSEGVNERALQSRVMP